MNISGTRFNLAFIQVRAYTYNNRVLMLVHEYNIEGVNNLSTTRELNHRVGR